LRLGVPGIAKRPSIQDSLMLSETPAIMCSWCSCHSNVDQDHNNVIYTNIESKWLDYFCQTLSLQLSQNDVEILQKKCQLSEQGTQWCLSLKHMQYSMRRG
jgi:hypothetical protein